MSGKWTPGPWHVATAIRGNGEQLIRNAQTPPQLIATVIESHRDHIARDNANLIAAAPELYAALKELVSAYTGSVGTAAGHTRLLDALDAAETQLAKARGES